MKKIFYLTFNGVMNNTNGIGTQTKLLLEGFECFFEDIQKKYGNLSLNIITPKYPKNYPGYSKEHEEFTESKIKIFQGSIFYCKNSKLIKNFWTTKYWTELSREAAKILKSQITVNDEVLVVCIDMPFMQTPIFFKKLHGTTSNIKWLICPYSSSYIHDKGTISNERLGWEYVGISSVRLNEDIYIADVCSFMKNHFIEYYGAPLHKYVPYSSSLFLQSSDFSKLEELDILKVLKKHQIPLNKDIILCFGRGVWIKGFDLLIKALNFVKGNFHLVLISVPTQSEISEYNNYVKLLRKANYSYTLISVYSRLLPKVLCQWERTKLVACPSRGEPFSNIPLEVSMWAKDKGPVVLASNIDGFVEQITEGFNGFLFQNESVQDLAKKINFIFKISHNALNKIRANAFKKVVSERDFIINFKKTLEYFWG